MIGQQNQMDELDIRLERLKLSQENIQWVEPKEYKNYWSLSERIKRTAWEVFFS